MPEPLKTLFDLGLIASIGAALAARDPRFDRAGFVTMAGDGLEALELKARSAQITRALEAHLPDDFPAACALLVAALHPDADAEPAELARSDAAGLRGWAVMPMADFVAARGLSDFDRSMAALGEMTKRFSAEFAVRAFLDADPDRGMAWMRRWALDPNQHVRRLASEGCRPRLPWGRRLRAFVADPAPVLDVLELLKDDPSEYVRRSVANNLNDIAKDHPDRAAAVAAGWLDRAPLDRRLARHALRGLVKAGHPGALAALGLGPAPVALDRLTILTPVVTFGGALEFAASLRLDGPTPREIALDYIIHHRKANGSTSPKVFKWKNLTVAPGAPQPLLRRHPMRPITTRTYYDGPHRLEVVANGASLGVADFALTGAGWPRANDRK